MRCGRCTSSREGTALLFRVAGAPRNPKKPVFHFPGPLFVTLHSWKRMLSASDSGPTPRRAKSDFLSVQKRFPISISDYVRAWWDRRGRSVLRLAIVVMSVLAALKLGDEFYRLLFSNTYTAPSTLRCVTKSNRWFAGRPGTYGTPPSYLSP